MVLGVLSRLGAAWACEPVGPALELAEQAVLRVRLDEASAALAEAEARFGCGPPVDPAALARFWVLEGAQASLAGDPEAARESFAAAGRTRPDAWIASLGPKLRASFAAAQGSSTGRGRIAVQPEGWPILVDGAPSSPGEQPAGLHLVQVLGEDGAVAFGRIVIVLDGLSQSLVTDLPPPEVVATPAPPPRAEPVVAPPPASVAGTAPGVALLLGAGAGAWVGEGLEGRSATGEVLTEPAVKVLVPLEAGVELDLGRTWARVVVGAAPLVGGRLLFGADGAWAGLPVALGGDLVAGVELGSAAVGALVGVSLPGRIRARAVGSLPLGSTPLRGELRLGAQAATERAVEPAGEVALVARLPGRG